MRTKHRVGDGANHRANRMNGRLPWFGISLSLSLSLSVGIATGSLALWPNQALSQLQVGAGFQLQIASVPVADPKGIAHPLRPTAAEIRESGHGRVGPSWRVRLMRGEELTLRLIGATLTTAPTTQPRLESIERRCLISRRRTCPLSDDAWAAA